MILIAVGSGDAGKRTKSAYRRDMRLNPRAETGDDRLCDFNGTDSGMRRLELDGIYDGPTAAVFVALCRTIAFRRWPAAESSPVGVLPPQGHRYRFRIGSLERLGRIVEVLRPVGLTLKELLHDPPCRVGLTMRWRIEPLPSGCAVRLIVRYRLNHAAMLRSGHWHRRLRLNLDRQFSYLALNLERLQHGDDPAAASAGREARALPQIQFLSPQRNRR